MLGASSLLCAIAVVLTIYNKGWPDLGTGTLFYYDVRSSRDLATPRNFHPPLLRQRSAAGPLTVTTTASGLLLQNDSAAAASAVDATAILAVRSTPRPTWPLQLGSQGREIASDAPGIRKDETGALNSTARTSGTCERAERAWHIRLTGGASAREIMGQNSRIPAVCKRLVFFYAVLNWSKL